jgi:sulfur relay (sulfurtransferase) DsrC/TusE family protein
MQFEVEGTTLAVDYEGYLVDPAQWSEQVAEELARRHAQAAGLEHRLKP